MTAFLASMQERDSTRGIINIVSYGYHEGLASGDQVVLPDGTVDPAYLQQRRLAEIESLKGWVRVFSANRRVSWVITVINKADLWWDKQEEVLQYYQGGPYLEALGYLQSLHRSPISYCSAVHRFYNTPALATSFDDADRLDLRRYLLNTLLAAAGQGSRSRDPISGTV
jgi:hypothetical protein